MMQACALCVSVGQIIPKDAQQPQENLKETVIWVYQKASVQSAAVSRNQGLEGGTERLQA
jgi:hypothetical protein